MPINLVCFVGKCNEPLFYYTNEDQTESLNLQMIANSSLDIMEERMEDSKQGVNLELFMGQLLAVDDYKVYGYLSNTKIKTIVICSNIGDYDADSPRASGNGQTFKDFTRQLYSLYVRGCQNPFKSVDEPCASNSFKTKVQAMIKSFR